MPWRFVICALEALRERRALPDRMAPLRGYGILIFIGQACEPLLCRVDVENRAEASTCLNDPTLLVSAKEGSDAGECRILR